MEHGEICWRLGRAELSTDEHFPLGALIPGQAIVDGRLHRLTGIPALHPGDIDNGVVLLFRLGKGWYGGFDCKNGQANEEQRLAC